MPETGRRHRHDSPPMAGLTPARTRALTLQNRSRSKPLYKALCLRCKDMEHGRTERPKGPFVTVLPFWRSILRIICVCLRWQPVFSPLMFSCVGSCLFPIRALQSEAGRSHYAIVQATGTTHGGAGQAQQGYSLLELQGEGKAGPQNQSHSFVGATTG